MARMNERWRTRTRSNGQQRKNKWTTIIFCPTTPNNEGDARRRLRRVATKKKTKKKPKNQKKNKRKTGGLFVKGNGGSVALGRAVIERPGPWDSTVLTVSFSFSLPLDASFYHPFPFLSLSAFDNSTDPFGFFYCRVVFCCFFLGAVTTGFPNGFPFFYFFLFFYFFFFTFLGSWISSAFVFCFFFSFSFYDPPPPTTTKKKTNKIFVFFFYFLVLNIQQEMIPFVFHWSAATTNQRSTNRHRRNEIRRSHWVISS